MSLFDTQTIDRRDAKHIRGRRFANVRRGYDPDQVREYLDQVATWVEQLEAELQSVRQEAVAANRKTETVDPYGQLGSHVAELIRGADEHATRARREAEEEAARLRGEAQADAERLRTETKVEAERTRQEIRAEVEQLRKEAEQFAATTRAEAMQALEKARADARDAVAEASGERDQVIAEMRETRERLATALQRLDDAVRPRAEEDDPWGPAEQPRAPAFGHGTNGSTPRVASGPFTAEPVAPGEERIERTAPPATSAAVPAATPPAVPPAAATPPSVEELFRDVEEPGFADEPIPAEPARAQESRPDARRDEPIFLDDVLLEDPEGFDLSIPDIPLIEDLPERNS
jgi:DivIVA domain-containing protein